MLVSKCCKEEVIVICTENGSYYTCAKCCLLCDVCASLTLGDYEEGIVDAAIQ